VIESFGPFGLVPALFPFSQYGKEKSVQIAASVFLKKSEFLLSVVLAQRFSERQFDRSSCKGKSKG
jgi:hypothetical protein